MIDYPVALKATGGARTGVPPANLLDIQDVNGNLYYFSDRLINAPVAITGAIAPYSSLVPPVSIPGGQQVAWAVPTTAVATPGVPSIATNATVSGLNGTLTQGEGDPFSTAGGIAWSGFTPPALPAGAVIDAVYITCLLARGQALAVVFTPFEPVAPTAGASGQFSGLVGSLTTLAEIAAYTLSISMHSTVGGYWPDELDVSDVAIAIYFHLPGGGSNGGYTNPGEAPYGNGPYLPWLLQVPNFTFHRSMQTDMGNFVVQNVSGDTLSRDMEKILRASTLEGAQFVYRCWQPDSEAAWIEVHGQLTMGSDGVDTVQLTAADTINAAQDDTPLELSCETCQLNWALARCGATGDTECQYSYQTCQVPEKIMVVMNNFEKNYGESTASIAVRPINRARKF
jgi:hypothetical protein